MVAETNPNAPNGNFTEGAFYKIAFSILIAMVAFFMATTYNSMQAHEQKTSDKLNELSIQVQVMLAKMEKTDENLNSLKEDYRELKHKK